MAPITICPIALPVGGFDALATEARCQRRDVVDRLERDWREGSNRFAGGGEVLLGAFDGDRLVGLGGLNQDPYVAASRIGRLRHLYVLSAWRRRGVGAALVNAILLAARQGGRFDCVRLRTSAPTAARLYERAGFVPVDDATATHILLVTTAGR